jgi:hypothetical protein
MSTVSTDTMVEESLGAGSQQARLLTACLSLGCHQLGTLNNRCLFPIVLESGKFKIKVLVKIWFWLVDGHVFTCNLSSVCAPASRKERDRERPDPPVKALILSPCSQPHLNLDIPSKAHLLIPSHQ